MLSNGFAIDVTVAGATTLTGGTIASTAAAARNLLTTGSLSSTDIENRERFAASSLNLGGGIGEIGKTTRGDATTGTDRVPGVSLPGIGNVSATLPSAMSASGRQGSTTVSAIAPGAIALTGDDPASRAVAAAISRDAPDADALTRRFDEAERRDIEQGFVATRALTNEVGTFFANRAAEEAELRKQAGEADAAGNTVEGDRLRGEADVLRGRYGAGSAARLTATALTGAAGSNVAGGLGGLAQGAAVNALQGLAAAQAKALVDRIFDPTTREVTRAALQAVVGCGGAVAGGSGACGSAAVGAAASVALNNLLKTGFNSAVGRDGELLSVEETEARANLIATFVAGLGEALGGNASAAAVAARIETENNTLNGAQVRIGAPVPFSFAELASVDERFRSKYEALGATEEVRAAELKRIVDCAQSSGMCDVNASKPSELAALYAWMDVTADTVRFGIASDMIDRQKTAELNRQQAALAGLAPLTVEDLLAGGRYVLDEIGGGIAYVDANTGRGVTRGLGLLQAGAGVFDILAGGGTALVAGAACPITGVSCFVAAGGVGLTAIGGDNAQAGLRTALTGTYTPTVGAEALSSMTGISVETSDLLYGLSTFGVGVAQKGVRTVTLRYATQAEREAALAADIARSAREGDSLAARADTEAGSMQPYAFFQKAAQAATHNPGATEVVLGRYIDGSPASYDAVARSRGSTYFSLKDWSQVGKEVGDDGLRSVNKAFLDQQI